MMIEGVRSWLSGWQHPGVARWALKAGRVGIGHVDGITGWR